MFIILLEIQLMVVTCIQDILSSSLTIHLNTIHERNVCTLTFSHHYFHHILLNISHKYYHLYVLSPIHHLFRWFYLLEWLYLSWSLEEVNLNHCIYTFPWFHCWFIPQCSHFQVLFLRTLQLQVKVNSNAKNALLIAWKAS